MRTETLYEFSKSQHAALLAEAAKARCAKMRATKPSGVGQFASRLRSLAGLLPSAPAQVRHLWPMDGLAGGRRS